MIVHNEFEAPKKFKLELFFTKIMLASGETELKNSNLSNSSFPWFHKLSPMNKNLNIQITLFSVASVASFLFIYYFSYLDFVEIFVRSGILPKNLSWMIYAGLSLIIIIILLLVFAPLSPRYFKIQSILDEKASVLDKVYDQMNIFEFAEAQETIEEYLERRYEFYLKDKIEDLLNLLNTVQKSEMMQKKFDYLSKLLEEGKKFELKKGYYEFSSQITFYKSEIHPPLLDKVLELQKQISDIRL